MDLKKLLTKKHATLYQQEVDGCMLAVKETTEYRWFEFGGNMIQSLMSKTAPEQILTQVSQSLLLFLLWKNKPLKILNLGLGGASLERTLATIPSMLLTSVEASPSVIDMAKQYFELPKKVHVICQKAEEYLQKTPSEIKFDVVLCDIFIDEKSPDFLFNDVFYIHLKNTTADNCVVLMNLQVETDEQLLLALFAIKKSFPYIALIEFDQYKNLVVICSSHEIPAREVLQDRLAKFTQVNFSHLDKIIEKIRYIPHTSSEC